MAKPTDRRPIDPSAPSAPHGHARPDPLQPVMHTGEVGVHGDPATLLASDSGGMSRAEDTPRAAGYVADLTRKHAAPPGPPVRKSPGDFTRPENEAPPPKKSRR